MDENQQDEADSKSILTENVRWVFNKRSKLWVPQHKKRKWFRRWKTFEDNVPFNWLNLIVALAIPFVVTFLGLYATQQITQQQALLNEKQHQIDLQIARDQQQEATLKSYLDDISDLLLNHNLHNAKPTDEVTRVARERTLTALRTLNAVRNKVLVQFLRDVQLINQVIDLRAADLSDDDLSSVNLDTVDLSYADLSGADLSYARLNGSRLRGAHLNGAYLKGARIGGADLIGAHLDHADLSGAYLIGARLNHADLSHANLSGAYLSRAYLIGANLSYANLNYADLGGAYLIDADLRGARVTQAQLANARSIQGTIMPNGSIHP